MSDSPHQYSASEREAIYRVIRERRDMRHFRPGKLDETVLKRLLTAAHQAPNVGLMQPWRIVRITQTELRNAIHKLVDKEREATAQALGERQHEFMRLKVEAIKDCGELLVVALMDKREPHIFGRRTMPEMDLASVACAIQNMWLAARAEGLGMGWVSIFDPAALAELLHIPEGAKPVAILCLGHVEAFYNKPMLEQKNWASRHQLDDMIYTNTWTEEKQKVTP